MLFAGGSRDGRETSFAHVGQAPDLPEAAPRHKPAGVSWGALVANPDPGFPNQGFSYSSQPAKRPCSKRQSDESPLASEQTP